MSDSGSPGMFDRWPASRRLAMRLAAAVTEMRAAPGVVRPARGPAPRWRRHEPTLEPSPSLSEEAAMTALYGRRTGTVVASPAKPPLA